MKYNKTFKNLA